MTAGSSGSSSASSPNMCANTSASKTLPGAETKRRILLTVESVAKSDTLGSKMRSGNARTLISGDLHRCQSSFEFQARWNSPRLVLRS